MKRSLTSKGSENRFHLDIEENMHLGGRLLYIARKLPLKAVCYAEGVSIDVSMRNGVFYPMKVPSCHALRLSVVFQTGVFRKAPS